MFVGAFDQFAVLEAGAGADEGDEVGCVHGTPAGLCGLDELERHGQAGRAGTGPFGVGPCADRRRRPHALGPNQFHGFGVDAGLGCFLDISAYPALDRLVGDLDTPFMDTLIADGTHGASSRDSETGLNVIAVESGWGDGSYPTWIGYTVTGEPAWFVTDFEVSDLT